KDVDAARREQNRLSAELQKADAERQRARADLAVALRSQAVAQSDLRELQFRYAILHAERERQVGLLTKVTERLDEVALYLQDVDAAAAIASEVAATLVEPLPRTAQPVWTDVARSRPDAPPHDQGGPSTASADEAVRT